MTWTWIWIWLLTGLITISWWLWEDYKSYRVITYGGLVVFSVISITLGPVGLLITFVINVVGYALKSKIFSKKIFKERKPDET